MSTLTATQLQQQYIAYFGRPGDPAGIKYWLSSSSGISSAREFADKIYAQDEYKTSTVGGKSTEAQVNSLYQNLFGREADAAGLIYWTGEIEAGTLTLSNIAYDLIAAASNPIAGNETQGAADALALSNKVAAATAFTADVEASTSAILAYQPETSTPWVTGAAFESGKSYLAGITTTAHTDAGIDAAVSSMVTANTSAGSSATGTTSKFTTSQDVFTGGAGNDTFSGVLIAQAGTGTTISPGDSVTGGAGTDTVNISVSGAHTSAYSLEAVDLDKVEKVFVSNYQTDDSYETTVSATLFDSSLTTVGVSSSASTGDTTFSGIKQIVDAEMRNGAGNLTLTYETDVLKGTADTQTLTVQGATAGTFTANGAETIAVTSELTKSTLTDITGTDTTKITFAGDKAIKVTSALDEKTIDASSNSGGVTITLATADQTITGGSGDDVIDGVGTVTSADTITGGSGTDTLKLTVGNATIDAKPTTTKGEISGVSGFETLQINSTHDSATLELDQTSGVTSVVADSNTVFLTLTSSGGTAGNFTGADTTFQATVDGTTFTSDSLDIHGEEANDAAAEDLAIIATNLASKINANAAYTATASAAVITITSTTDDVIDAAAVAKTAGATLGSTEVEAAVSFTKAGAQTYDIYRSGNTTISLNDASGLDDSITVNLKSNTANKAVDHTVDDVTFTNVETLNLNTSGLNTDAYNTGKTYTLAALSGDSKLTTLNITGDNNITISDHGSDNSKLATINASSMTKNVILSDARSALAQTITTGSGNDSVAFAGNLTEDDVVDLGGNTASSAGVAGTDKVTATGNLGTSVDDSVLQLSNVEAFELDTSAASAATYIDASKLVNVSSLAFAATDGTVKIKNLGASPTIGLGIGATEFSDTSNSTTLNVALADETGTSDTLTLDISDTQNAASSTTLKSTGIENLNIKAGKGGNAVTSTFVFGDNAPSTITITDGVAADTIALGTLNKTTTTVNASGQAGITTLTGATGIAMTVSANGKVANNIVTSTGNDTFTISGDLGTTDPTYTGGSGTDSISLDLSSSASNFGNITGFETLNLNIKNSTATGLSNAGDDDALQTANTINILGGNALSTFVVTTANFNNVSIDQTIDASGFNGSIDLELGKAGDTTDALDEHMTIIGGSSTTDKITVNIADNTGKKAASVTGVETLEVLSTSTDADAAIDLTNVSGLTSIEATFVGTAGDQIELIKAPQDVTVKVTSTSTGGHALADADNLVLTMANASASGTKAAIEVSAFHDTAGTDADILNLDGAGIEDLTINNKSGTSDNGFNLGGVTADTDLTTTLTISGKGGELFGLGTNFTTINGAASTGTIEILAAQRTTTAMTFTGGTGGDNVAMESGNDVMNAGLGTDTIILASSAVLGGFAVDLTSTTDQVTQFAGVTNPAIQNGFENVSGSGITGSFGMDVTGSTGANTITGSVAVDIIKAGKGNDVIVASGSVDELYGEAGDDEFRMTDQYTSGSAVVDVIKDWGTGTDTISVSLADIESATAHADLVSIGDSSISLAAGAAMTVQKVTASTYNLDLTEATMLALDSTIAFTATTAAAAISASGDHVLTVDKALADNDAFLMFYDDNTHSYLAAVESVGGTGDNIALIIAKTTVTNLVKFEGIANAGTAFTSASVKARS